MKEQQERLIQERRQSRWKLRGSRKRLRGGFQAVVEEEEHEEEQEEEESLKPEEEEDLEWDEDKALHWDDDSVSIQINPLEEEDDEVSLNLTLGEEC